MKLNTLHAIFTLEHSIAVGSHFYSFSNLRQSFYGLVHAFFMDSLIMNTEHTNTEHLNTRVLLFCMTQYVYKFYVQGAN